MKSALRRRKHCALAVVRRTHKHTNRHTNRHRRLQYTAQLSAQRKYKLLCPRGTQTCALAVANIAHAVYLLDVAKRPIPQG